MTSRRSDIFREAFRLESHTVDLSRMIAALLARVGGRATLSPQELGFFNIDRRPPLVTIHATAEGTRTLVLDGWKADAAPLAAGRHPVEDAAFPGEHDEQVETSQAVSETA